MVEYLIITLAKHPRFGYLLQPVFAEYAAETELYSITEIARAKSLGFLDLSDTEKKIVLAAERFSNKALMKTYSREKNEDDFLQNVSDETIATYICPFIENWHKEIVRLMRETQTPVFLRKAIRDRDFRQYDAIKVLPNPSKMVFQFSNTDVFTYSVQVKNEPCR